MSDLIAIGKSGVLAYQGALATISDNVVNANNDGFARRQVSMHEQTAPGGPMSGYRTATVFSGVSSVDVTRVWDQYSAQRAWSAGSDSSQASTRSQWYGTVEGALDDGDTGVGSKLTAIFTSASALSANPKDTALRQNFLYALQDAAGAINRTASGLKKIAGTVSDQATDATTQLNAALTALARTNISLKTAAPGTSGRAALEDQRDKLIGTISDKAGVDVTLDTYGAATLRMNDASGPLLLDSNKASPEQVNVHAATTGALSFTVTSSGTSGTSVSPMSGSLAGYAEAANQLVGRRQQLDTLAGNLAQRVNAWNAQGKDLNGNNGADLMSGTDASSLALAVSDPSLIAAADTSTDNGNLLTLSALRDTSGAEQSWRTMITDQGLKVQSAKDQADSATSAKDSAYSDLDSVSGVDLDSEAADLLRFQQAYSASAKVIQTARETMQMVLNLF